MRLTCCGPGAGAVSFKQNQNRPQDHLYVPEAGCGPGRGCEAGEKKGGASLRVEWMWPELRQGGVWSREEILET